MEEDKVSISTVLRQAVSVEISLSNPLNEELQFLVSLQVSKAALVYTETRANEVASAPV